MFGETFAEILAELFGDQYGPLLEVARLDASSITLTGGARQAWSNVIKKARDLHRIEELRDAATSEYANQRVRITRAAAEHLDTGDGSVEQWMCDLDRIRQHEQLEILDELQKPLTLAVATGMDRAGHKYLSYHRRFMFKTRCAPIDVVWPAQPNIRGPENRLASVREQTFDAFELESISTRLPQEPELFNGRRLRRDGAWDGAWEEMAEKISSELLRRRSTRPGTSHVQLVRYVSIQPDEVDAYVLRAWVEHFWGRVARLFSQKVQMSGACLVFFEFLTEKEDLAIDLKDALNGVDLSAARVVQLDTLTAVTQGDITRWLYGHPLLIERLKGSRPPLYNRRDSLPGLAKAIAEETRGSYERIIDLFR